MATDTPPPLPPAWTYVLRQQVPGHSADVVYKYLCRPETPAELHPLIVRFEVIDARHVVYYDRMQVLGMPLRDIRVPAEQTTVPAERKLYFETRVSGTHVLHEYAVEPTADGCEVVDSVLVEAPWGLRGYVVRTAREAHAGMLAALPAGVGKYLESQSGHNR